MKQLREIQTNNYSNLQIDSVGIPDTCGDMVILQCLAARWGKSHNPRVWQRVPCMVVPCLETYGTIYIMHHMWYIFQTSFLAGPFNGLFSNFYQIDRFWVQIDWFPKHSKNACWIWSNLGPVGFPTVLPSRSSARPGDANIKMSCSDVQKEWNSCEICWNMITCDKSYYISLMSSSL